MNQHASSLDPKNNVDLRWESDGSADPSITTTHRELCGVHTAAVHAGCAAKGRLLYVGVTPMTQLLLLTGAGTQSRVTNKHAETLEALSFSFGGCMEEEIVLTGLKAVTLVFPSYGGMK